MWWWVKLGAWGEGWVLKCSGKVTMTNLKSAHQDPLEYSPEPMELLGRWVCGQEVVHHPWVRWSQEVHLLMRFQSYSCPAPPATAQPSYWLQGSSGYICFSLAGIGKVCLLPFCPGDAGSLLLVLYKCRIGNITEHSSCFGLCIQSNTNTSLQMRWRWEVIAKTDLHSWVRKGALKTWQWDRINDYLKYIKLLITTVLFLSSKVGFLGGVWWSFSPLAAPAGISDI